MQIIPVIDLLDGVVVRGVAGRRSEYRPVESRLVAGSNAIDVAHAFRDHFGFNQLYVADLDAIMHGRPQLETYRALAADGFELLVDSGLRELADARAVFDTGAAAVIAALETSPGPEHLHTLCAEYDADRIVFSLDLTDGKPMAVSPAWRTDDPLTIARLSVEAGVRRMIVLDLSRVGVGEGIGTARLCVRIKRKFPELRLITGGGVRGVNDIRGLESLGLEGVLVASALHDGSISPTDVSDFRSKTSG